MNNVMNIMIVSRHQAAINFALEEAKRLFQGRVNFSVAEHATGKESVDAVIGVLPIPLIRLFQERGVEVYILSLPNLEQTQRGKELSPAEMRAAGARIDRVSVQIQKPYRRYFVRWVSSMRPTARGWVTQYHPDPRDIPQGWEISGEPLEEEAIEDAMILGGHPEEERLWIIKKAKGSE